VKTGVQSIAKVLKTLDSGFRRNDVKKNEINFFTPSERDRVGVILGIFSQLRGLEGFPGNSSIRQHSLFGSDLAGLGHFNLAVTSDVITLLTPCRKKNS